MNIRTPHAAVQDVSQNRDIQIIDLAFRSRIGERVQQTLRGMLVRAVTRIDHRISKCRATNSAAPEAAWRITRQSGFMAFSVWAVSEQRLALFQARCFRLQVHHIRAKSRRRGSKAYARARRAFKKASATVLPRNVASFLGVLLDSWKACFDREEK